MQFKERFDLAWEGLPISLLESMHMKKYNSETAHVVYASDDKFAEILGVSLVSLYENSKDMCNIVVYVLDSGIEKKNRDRLLSVSRNYNRPEIRFIPAKNISEKLSMNVAVDRGSLSQYASSKCLIDKDSALEASIRTLNKSIGKIPNISTIYNEDFFDVFILGNSKYEDSERYGYREKIKLSGTREIAFLPIAVNTSRLNPRMRSQSGMFLAYNLYTEPSIGEGYSYMELEKIQSYYLNECRAADRKQFLYKIIIERSAASRIANSFRALGLSKERVYPELANVGKRIL